jgi:D-alanyl-D-alanine carboxypeptidase
VGKEPIRRHAGFLGFTRVTLDRRKPEGREEPIPVLDVEPRSKRRPATLLGPTRRRRWRGGRSVIIFALLVLFGVGYSFPPEQETARSVIHPSVHLDTPSRPSAAGTVRSPIRRDDASLGQEAKEKVLAERLSAPAKNCGELRVLVDRSHSLPPDYVPDDLVPLRAYRVPTLGSEVLQLRRDAAEQLERLVEVAAVDGEELVVASAYRSYEEQQASHDRLVSVYGSRRADAMSATPGHSQHQLGTAVDFTNAAASYQVWMLFGETTAYWWLEHHAREYGFVQAYPRGKEEETGYQWEPWHYRYVGVENAQRLQDSGLSLQQFLEREGIIPHC